MNHRMRVADRFSLEGTWIELSFPERLTQSELRDAADWLAIRVRQWHRSAIPDEPVPTATPEPTP